MLLGEETVVGSISSIPWNSIASSVLFACASIPFCVQVSAHVSQLPSLTRSCDSQKLTWCLVSRIGGVSSVPSSSYVPGVIVYGPSSVIVTPWIGFSGPDGCVSGEMSSLVSGFRISGEPGFEYSTSPTSSAFPRIVLLRML